MVWNYEVQTQHMGKSVYIIQIYLDLTGSDVKNDLQLEPSGQYNGPVNLFCWIDL